MLNLRKAYRVQLKDTINTLKVEVTWERPIATDIDIDLISIVLNKDGKVLNENDSNVIFYNHPEASNKSIRLVHTDRTGGGNGEIMEFDLTKIDGVANRIDIILNNFNKKRSLFNLFYTIRVYFNGHEKPDLVFDQDDPLVRSDSTLLEIGSLIRLGERWELKVENMGHNKKLSEYLAQYGIECSDK